MLGVYTSFQIVVLSSWLDIATPLIILLGQHFAMNTKYQCVVAITQQQASALGMGTPATLYDSRTVSISRIFL